MTMYLHFHGGVEYPYETDCQWQYTVDMPCPSCQREHQCGPCPSGGRDA